MSKLVLKCGMTDLILSKVNYIKFVERNGSSSEDDPVNLNLYNRFISVEE